MSHGMHYENLRKHSFGTETMPELVRAARLDFQHRFTVYPNATILPGKTLVTWIKKHKSRGRKDITNTMIANLRMASYRDANGDPITHFLRALVDRYVPRNNNHLTG